MSASRWDWIKEKVADALVSSVVVGITILIGYGVLQAFIGDSKLDKASEKLRKEMIDKHNESIARESELLGQVVELKRQLERHVNGGQPETPPVALFAPSMAEPGLPNPAQERLDFEKRHRLQYKE